MQRHQYQVNIICLSFPFVSWSILLQSMIYDENVLLWMENVKNH